MKTITLRLQDGSTKTVEKFAAFNYEIGGQSFRFCVTESLDTVGKCITHEVSGLKVCPLSVGASYLPAFAHLGTDEARAMVALEQLIDRHGAARIRSVISAAE
jgi:hypothetical protein